MPLLTRTCKGHPTGKREKSDIGCGGYQDDALAVYHLAAVVVRRRLKLAVHQVLHGLNSSRHTFKLQSVQLNIPALNTDGSSLLVQAIQRVASSMQQPHPDMVEHIVVHVGARFHDGYDIYACCVVKKHRGTLRWGYMSERGRGRGGDPEEGGS